MTLDIQHDLLLFLQVFNRIVPTAYPVNRYGAGILPWEKQPKPVNIPNDYQLKTPFTKTRDTKKDY